MQEIVKTNSENFLKLLSKAGFCLKAGIRQNIQFPICVDFDLKIAFRLTSVTCLAQLALSGKKFLTQNEFFDKYILL